MRYLFALPAIAALNAAAQFPLPYWEAFDSTRVVLAQLHSDEFLAPDTLWANGHIAVPIAGFDTVMVDQCCMDPDPPILLARLKHWPKDQAGDPLPLFAERLTSVDDEPLIAAGPWPMPDTMIPLTASPSTLTRYIWHIGGLEVQSDHYGTWRSQRIYHVDRAACPATRRDSLRLAHCSPSVEHMADEPALLMLFVNDKLVEVFQDNRNSTLDSWNCFVRSSRASLVTGSANGSTAIVLSSGEVIERSSERWKLTYREPSIYRGECDCE